MLPLNKRHPHSNTTDGSKITNELPPQINAVTNRKNAAFT